MFKKVWAFLVNSYFNSLSDLWNSQSNVDKNCLDTTFLENITRFLKYIFY